MPWLLDLHPVRSVAAVVLPLLVVGGCFKTLDESLLEEKQDGGKTGGSGGSSGDASTGGSGGITDGAVEAQVIIPYDAAKYPVVNLANGTAPIIIAADDNNVFRTTKDAVNAQLVAQPIASGSGVLLPDSLERPQALMTPPSSTWVYVAGGDNVTGAGSLVRVSKNTGTPLEPISTGGTNIELAVGLTSGTDGFGYVSLKAVNINTVSVMRFPLANTSPAEAVFTATAPNESGGDIAVAAGCVYWISNGTIWLTQATGGSRKSATANPITDGIGLTTDSTNLYYTRTSGSVWRRPLSGGTCDGTGDPEALVADGFPGIGDVIRHGVFLAWVAKGEGEEFTGGGVFKQPVDGGDITQIAPADDGPIGIDQGKDDIVFSTSTFGLRKVPKQPQ